MIYEYKVPKINIMISFEIQLVLGARYPTAIWFASHKNKTHDAQTPISLRISDDACPHAQIRFEWTGNWARHKILVFFLKRLTRSQQRQTTAACGATASTGPSTYKFVLFSWIDDEIKMFFSRACLSRELHNNSAKYGN